MARLNRRLGLLTHVRDRALLIRLPKPKGLPITLVLGHGGRVLQTERGELFPEEVAQLSQWLK